MDTENPQKEPENTQVSSKEVKSEETEQEKEVKEVKPTKKPYYIGAHVSSAGGAFNAVENASLIGANAFALFLKYMITIISLVKISKTMGDAESEAGSR